MAVLGDEFFAVYFIDCRDESYAALLYRGKIAVVEKSAFGQGPADRLVARFNSAYRVAKVQSTKLELCRWVHHRCLRHLRRPR